MAIHKIKDGCYAISIKGCWLEGCFEDERAARFGFRCTNSEIYHLQECANVRAGGSGGIITWGDIAKMKDQKRSRK